MTEDRRPLKSRSYAWVRALAKSLATRGVKPNHISLAGVGIAVAGFACMWGVSRGWPLAWTWMLAAAVCVQGRLMCNLLDGLVAVEGGLKSQGGDLFNEIPDRIEDPLFLVGAGYAAGCVELGWACAVLAVFTAYVRAFGASLGQGQDFGGPCAKQQRMFLLTAGLVAWVVAYFCLLPWNVLAVALWFIAVGTALTAALRIRRMYRKAK
ncbi:MAG: CDP-alcohol phosphatidyltransferase family protein [Chthoniobacteraceae bacterium]